MNSFRQAAKSSKLEFGVPWIYWLCAGMALVMFFASVACAVFCEDLKERRAGWAGSVIFFTTGFGSMLWPVLRKREPKTAQQEFVHLFSLHCEAIVFPMSRVKQFITIAGAILLSVGMAMMVLFAEENVDRAKAAIALVFLLCAVTVGTKSLLAGKKGIFLVPAGIIWNEMFRFPCFIPWEIVGQSALFLKAQQYGPEVWTFGLQVTDTESLQTSRWTRKKFVESRNQHGWHCLFLQETILTPLDLVARVIEFYRQHPEVRREIGTTNSFARIESLGAPIMSQ